ncbi:MAG: hypothetical protein NUV63_14105 [Gallionella sp.]|nr:hypothetical protein [Gallionella sp.]
MTLERTIVHEIHEKTRTKPKNYLSMRLSLMGESLNECNRLLSFVPFVFFVDDTEVLGMAQLGIVKLKGSP